MGYVNSLEGHSISKAIYIGIVCITPLITIALITAIVEVHLEPPIYHWPRLWATPAGYPTVVQWLELTTLTTPPRGKLTKLSPCLNWFRWWPFFARKIMGVFQGFCTRLRERLDRLKRVFFFRSLDMLVRLRGYIWVARDRPPYLFP